MIQTQRSDQRIGTIPAAAHLALDVIERGQLTTIGIIQDIRTEVRGVVDGGIELAEKVVGAMFRISRKVTQRLDGAVGDTLDGVERLVVGSMRTNLDTPAATPRTASA